MPKDKHELDQQLNELIDDYARYHGGLFEGMAALGEALLMQADARASDSVSWLSLILELQRRSG